MAGKLQKISFKNFRAQIMSIEYIPRILVTWDLNPTMQNLKDLFFFIDRGESPEDLKQLNAVGIPANTLYEFMDLTSHIKDLSKVYYYRIRAAELANLGPNAPINAVRPILQTFSTPTFTWDGDLDLEGLYVVEEHLFAHRYVYGVPILVYKKMREGDRCTECWDEVLKRVTKSNCKTCHGTGRLGGYYDPIPAWMDFNPSPKTTQIADWGPKQSRQSDTQFTNYPILTEGDIVYECKPGKLHRVSNIRFTEKSRVIMLQVARVDEVNRSDIEYSIEIPHDIVDEMVHQLEERKEERVF